MSDKPKTVWVVMHDYESPGTDLREAEPEAAFFSRRELEKWVESSGGWGDRWYCSCALPERVILTKPQPETVSPMRADG